MTADRSPMDRPAARFGIIVTAGDPRTAAELAASAEAHGWDGVFTWDGIAIGSMEIYDPWVVMTAMAMRTSRVVLGAIVSPPSRRRPWKLAREAMSVDRVSDGRLVLPVGLGALDDAAFGNVGEPTDAKTRAELLDETLAILDGLWSGEPFGHDGRHYRFAPMTFRPTPVQRPRIPIWVVGAWPAERSMARAARWDGLVAQVLAGELTPEGLRDAVAWVRGRRTADGLPGPYDVIAQGSTRADDPASWWPTVAPWIEAGATWWIEADWETWDVDAIARRIEAGPPRPPAG
jgi:alkanesulfonate monooxygenase SsuD/methylene tetrahydromethanopterin reductase-like flavin-dependent oxidoreductase (luciferase family)